MILIDALFVNGGGGKVLLDYLVEELEKTSFEVLYLLDDRIKEIAPPISKQNSVVFLEGSFFKRKNFYKENRQRFTTVFCFGNLPPNIKLKDKTITYFHQNLYLSVPQNTHIKDRFKFWLKTRVLNSIKSHTDLWMVQNETIKNNFSRKYTIPKAQVLVRPFFKSLVFASSGQKKKNTFLYVSNATPHKNHRFLIEEFCTFYDQHHTGELILTVSATYPEILELVVRKQAGNYPITNLGFVDKTELAEVYLESEFVIYPSLSESFGLGLVEGIEAGCKVIGVDLPYLHEVCIPSLTYKANEKNAIVKSLEVAVTTDLPNSTSKVKDTVDQIIAEFL